MRSSQKVELNTNKNCFWKVEQKLFTEEKQNKCRNYIWQIPE